MRAIVFISAIVLLAAVAVPARAEMAAPPANNCASASDLACMTGLLDSTAATITEKNWRDQTLRELAKLMAKQERYDDAVALLPRIENPDTRAMTIRGIGMAAASLKKPPESYKDLFDKLAAAAAQIDHPPSFAIAQTYIAMSQAFAADDTGATKTALAMENAALRNKALAESAEIQAEREDLEAALVSIGHIDDASFRDKAHRTIAKILSDRKQYDKALAAAMKIDNNYQRAQAILHILARQVSPDEISVE
jgi:tetratricopeptide (TPR) repeat protein